MEEREEEVMADLAERRLATLEERSKNTQEAVDRIECKLDSFMDSVEHRFAAKWVESTLKALGGGALLVCVYVIVQTITNNLK